MKKLLLISMLLIVGAAFAASTMPTQGRIDARSDVQSLTIYCWEGTASVIWDRFEIYYHKETGEMWGTWYRGEDEGGWIYGVGEWDPDVPRILGSGTFGGDDSGEWEGIFYPYSRCWGKVWNPDAIGDFYGRPCE